MLIVVCEGPTLNLLLTGKNCCYFLCYRTHYFCVYVLGLLCKFWTFRISAKEKLREMFYIWFGTQCLTEHKIHTGSQSDNLCLNIYVLRTLPCLYLQAETLTSDALLSCKWHRLARVASDLRKTKQLMSEESVNGNLSFSGLLNASYIRCLKCKESRLWRQVPNISIHGDK